MSPALKPPSPELRRKLEAFASRTLSREEVETASVPMTEEERAEARALIAWFRRRYPTPAERLAYVRRAYRRWTAAR